jgi:site-specific DNA-methyltransferase (adenine-specific)
MDQIEPGSIDLIFTDPPYIQEIYQSAYSVLARPAERVLKPSGFLITYAPQYRLNEILEILGKHLTYFWQAIQLNESSRMAMVYQNRVMCGYKPILIYQKSPHAPPKKVSLDVIRGRKAKKYHPWEQSIHEALHLLSRFAVPGEIMLDPYAGSGTSLLAAKLLGLQYIGFEYDPEYYEIALTRLNQVPLDLKTFKEGAEA